MINCFLIHPGLDVLQEIGIADVAVNISIGNGLNIGSVRRVVREEFRTMQRDMETILTLLRDIMDDQCTSIIGQQRYLRQQSRVIRIIRLILPRREFLAVPHLPDDNFSFTVRYGRMNNIRSGSGYFMRTRREISIRNLDQLRGRMVTRSQTKILREKIVNHSSDHSEITGSY